MTPAPRILIVDDEERFRTTLSRCLEEHQFEVYSMGSGEEALAQIKHRCCDVVILDVKMPGLGGLETLAEIKKTAPDIEVILLTGNATVDSALLGLRTGAYDYLLKPCDLEILLSKIKSASDLKAARNLKLRQAGG